MEKIVRVWFGHMDLIFLVHKDLIAMVHTSVKSFFGVWGFKIDFAMDYTCVRKRKRCVEVFILRGYVFDL